MSQAEKNKDKAKLAKGWIVALIGIFFWVLSLINIFIGKFVELPIFFVIIILGFFFVGGILMFVGMIIGLMKGINYGIKNGEFGVGILLFAMFFLALLPFMIASGISEEPWYYGNNVWPFIVLIFLIVVMIWSKIAESLPLFP